MMVETVLLLIFSLLLGVGCLVLAGWLVVTHQFATLDGIFVPLLCLVLALVFFLTCGRNLRSEEVRQWWETRAR